MRILPVRRKTFEVTTLKRRKLLQLTSDNERRPDGASDCGCDWILSSNRPGWVAGSLWRISPTLILLFYYILLRTNVFWDRLELYLIDKRHELLKSVRVMA